MNTCCTETYYTHCEKIPSCLATLSINTDVQEGSVIVQIRDKFGNVYALPVTTDNLGVAIVDLDIETLPEGLLNAYAGQFDLSVTNKRLLIDGTEYAGVRFSVAKYWIVEEEANYLFNDYTFVA